MKLCNISVQNFRTFDNLELELNELNVVIGANASGKSNLLDIIKFIGDLSEYGLEDAIYLQGGIEEIKNRSIGENENFSLGFKADDINKGTIIPSPIDYNEDYLLEFHITSFEYFFELDLDSGEYKVIDEDLEITWEIAKIKKNGSDKESPDEVLETNPGIRIYREDESYNYTIEYPDIEMSEKEFKKKAFPFAVLPRIEEFDCGQKELIIETIHETLFKSVKESLSSTTVYNFEPHNVKTGSQVTGTKELESDGSNLSIVLEDIGKNSEKRKDFNNLAKELIPFTEDYSVKKNEDRSFHLRIQETFFSSQEETDKNLASPSMISDGTVNIYALIVALYFESNPLIGIEEPEKNIHPALLSKVVRMMEESSAKKQIIATTHEPRLLKEIELDDILMIKRNEEGFSQVTKPKNNELISRFLDENIGIEELMKDNMMG